MGRGKKKNKRGGKKHAGNDRFQHVPRGRLPFMKPGLPLSNEILARFSPGFNVHPLTEERQKDISKLVWTMFEPDLTPFVKGDPAQGADVVNSLVHKHRGTAMARLQPRIGGQLGYFMYRNGGPAHIFFTNTAFETVKNWSDADLAQRLWTLWALDVHTNKYNRWTFIPYALDQETRQREKTSGRQASMNRALYEAFFPFIGGKVTLTSHFKPLVDQYSGQARQAMYAMSDNLPERKKKFVKQAASMNQSRITGHLIAMFEAGVDFSSHNIGHPMLGAPLTSGQADMSDSPDSSDDDGDDKIASNNPKHSYRSLGQGI